MIFLKKNYLDTKKGLDFLSIHHDVKYALRDSKVKDGQVNVIITKGNAGLAVFEPLNEIKEAFGAVLGSLGGLAAGKVQDNWKKEISVAPRVLSNCVGRSLTIPVSDSKLALDVYDEIHLIIFEETPYRLEYIVQVIGETGEQDAGGKGGAKPQRPQQARK